MDQQRSKRICRWYEPISSILRTGAVDPSGTDILIPKDAYAEIKELLSFAGVSGYTITEEGDTIRIHGQATPGYGPRTAALLDQSQVYAELISAGTREFRIDDSAGLKVHANARIAIAVRADTAEFGFGPTRLNRNLWRSYDDGLILPKSIYDATLDLWKNPQQHSFYCTRATAFCVHAGIADAMGKEWTDKNGNRFFFLPEGDPAAMRRGLLEHTVQDTSTAVSYTHLTLPTIYTV